MLAFISLSSIFLQAVFSQSFTPGEDLAIYVHSVLLRQFASGRSLSVSLPNWQQCGSTVKFGVISSILKFLHDDIFWPLNVFHYNNDKPEANSSNLLKMQGYLIFTLPCPDVEDITADLGKQISGLSSLEVWNAKSQFFIVVTNMMDQFIGELANDILQELWNYNVFKAFVIIPIIAEFNTAIKKPELMPKFNLYTRIPYHSAKICLKFSDAFLLEQWSKEFNNNSVSLKKILKHTIPTNFNSCPLRVLAHSKEYKWEVDNKGEKRLKYYDPLLLLLSVVLEKLNITLVQTPPKVINDSYKEMENVLENVFFGETDIGSGVIMDFWPAMFADFARNGIAYQCVWYVPCKQYKSRVTTVTRIFNASVWFTIASSILLTSFMMKIITIICTHKGVSESSLFKSISNCLCSLWAVLLGVGLHKLPSSSSLRTLFLIFVCYSFGLNTIFQTYFTSLLVDPGYEHQIESVEEFLRSNLEFGYFPAFDYHFFVSSKKSDKEILKRRIYCNDRKYCFDRVNREGDFVYFELAVIGELYKRLYDEDARMCSLDQGTIYTIATIYMKRDNVLLGIIDRKLLELFEAGVTMKFKYEQILAYKIGILKVPELQANESFVPAYNLKEKDYRYVQLGLTHLQVAFYLLMLGISLSIISLIIELFYITKNKTNL
ncbi:Ionotropic receptor 666 [Blattella germanica]|nr:Ionotropic receptor 666 [Blattella germanica]